MFPTAAVNGDMLSRWFCAALASQTVLTAGSGAFAMVDDPAGLADEAFEAVGLD